MDATMKDSSWEGQEELENIELQMMASFQEVSIAEMDMSLFMDMLAGFEWRNHTLESKRYIFCLKNNLDKTLIKRFLNIFHI